MMRLLSEMGWADCLMVSGLPTRENLLLSGHWTQPAIGVFATVISGLKVARMILKRAGVDEPLADTGIRKGVMTR